MDFLDPQKQFRHQIMLYVGYVLIAIAILFGTTVLLYQAYGFGVGKNGQIIQSGLLFFSSQPHPAQIYLNGVLNKAQTNSRVVVPAGQYKVQIERSGYRAWQRTVSVQGSDVQHFDYPFLFPKTLTTTTMAPYVAAPGISTQSPDHRWLLTEQANSFTNFDLYDLKNPTVAPTTVSLPSNLISKATSSQSWQLVEWADDNQHVLLQHSYDGATEFIVIDRQNPDQSVNLNKTLSVSPNALTLDNKKYDQYYIYTANGGSLTKASLKSPTVTPFVSNVASYKSYGDDSLLYATSTNAPSGKVNINLLIGSKTYLLRQLPAGTSYLLDIATYSGTPFVVLGAASENQVYIYKDPVGQLSNQSLKLPAPIRVLRVPNPTYESFSPNAQFIAVEGGTQFALFDAEHTHTYHYTSAAPLDAPQAHASWMDGDRLTYVSAGKVVVFDYDDANQQTLMPATSAYLPFFAPDYHYLYSLAPASGTAVNLTKTALLIPADL